MVRHGPRRRTPLLGGLSGLRALAALPRLATGLPDTLARVCSRPSPTRPHTHRGRARPGDRPDHRHRWSSRPLPDTSPRNSSDTPLSRATAAPRRIPARPQTASRLPRRPPPLQHPHRRRRSGDGARLDRRPDRPPRLRPRLHRPAGGFATTRRPTGAPAGDRPRHGSSPVGSSPATGTTAAHRSTRSAWTGSRPCTPPAVRATWRTGSPPTPSTGATTTRGTVSRGPWAPSSTLRWRPERPSIEPPARA